VVKLGWERKEMQGMKDKEARGIVLRRLYELRDHGPANPRDFMNLGFAENAVARYLGGLAEDGYVKWKPLKGLNEYLAYMAEITSRGSDVVEGVSPPPTSITIDNRIAIHGSQGVQIGGQGNVLNVTLDVERLNSFIDSSDATVHEKEEAKGLLKRLSENPLVKGAFEWLLKSYTGK
jgi:hypothetical protein